MEFRNRDRRNGSDRVCDCVLGYDKTCGWEFLMVRSKKTALPRNSTLNAAKRERRRLNKTKTRHGARQVKI